MILFRCSGFRSVRARSRSFEIGFKDTMHSIKTFPLGGTDKFKTLSDFKAGMFSACEKCGNKGYVEGVIEALKVGGVL